MRREFSMAVVFVLALNALGYFFFPWILWSLVIFGPLIALGVSDMLQTRHSVLRNFPILGHFRFFFEAIRPEINQYFVESNSDGVPFSREQRSVVYQRAKKALDTLPFGTQRNVYEVGYEWVNHSIQPAEVDPASLRVTVGGPDCKQPYSASRLNVSAMSFGSLSKNAILALNGGARIGGFAHNTGEGGLTPYHLSPGGDIIWQIGTGYFGCRSEDGRFDADKFKEKALLPQVKMIEIKLSQGAKPGHGGILPAAKVTREIAEIRGVPMGKDVLSPPGHSAFSTPMEMMHFIQELRDACGGKPVGFKLCLGRRREFLALCKAMVETGISPDFITVDGGEGGTGAAPLEFSNSVGCPLREALIFVHNALVGYSLRSRVRLISSGKVTTGFDLVAKIAIGADMCNAARAMMMALGCIQALRCNTNHCPVGVATQQPSLVKGLVVEDKKYRVASFHHETLKSLAEIIGAMGLSSPDQLRPWHLMRRVGFTEINHYGELYGFLSEGDLLKEPLPAEFDRACRAATPKSFRHLADLGGKSERS
jgi:glutamate synthase domain-containing protein 2